MKFNTVNTIPADDQTYLMKPKKNTNFKGRLIGAAALAFALGAIVATSGGGVTHSSR